MIDRQRARFEADPDDAKAFGALEEDLFLRGDWAALVALYWRRLGAPGLASHAGERARLLQRMGQVLEERCQSPEPALACLREAVRLAPGQRPLLRSLRRALLAQGAKREAWEAAEREAALPLPPAESGAVWIEAARGWRDGVRDLERAALCFQQAAAVLPDSAEALEGLAGICSYLGRHADAADAYTRLAAVTKGEARLAALSVLAQLCDGPIGAPERATEAWRAVLAVDPRDRLAVEGLAARAALQGNWRELADLGERRFELAEGAQHRAEVALETAGLHIERTRDLDAAARWLARAEELAPDDLRVQLGLAAVARCRGDRRGLAARLERLLTSAPDRAPVETWVEAASLAAEQGDTETCLARLRAALTHAPDDGRLLDFFAEQLAGAGLDDELALVLERRAGLLAGDPERQAAVLARLAEIHATRHEDLAAARDAWERAFVAWPATPGCVDALQQLYGKTEAWDDLRALLERAVALPLDAAAPGAAAARAATLCHLGELLLRRTDDADAPAAARRRFEEALALAPEDARALRGLEEAALLGRDPAAVIEAYEREAAVTREPARLAELARELSRRHEAGDRLADAVRWAERRAEVDPSPEAFVRCAALHERLGDDAALCRALERGAAAASPREAAALWRRVGALHAAGGREADAVRAYEAALTGAADDAESLEALVALHEAGDRPKDLVLVLERLARVAPPDRRVACLDAVARLRAERLDDPAGAIAVLERLAAAPGAPADTDLRLEALLEATGRTEALVAHLAARRARLLAQPDVASDLRSERQAGEIARIDLRRAAALESLGRIEEAAAVYAVARCERPGDPLALAGVERTARALGDDSTLVAALLAGAALVGPEAGASRRFEAATLLADVLERPAEAQPLLAALADEPSAPEIARAAADRLERLLEREGDWPELRARLERRAAAMEPNEAFALHERLARLCRDRLGDREGALRHFERAGALRPERPEIWQSLALLYTEADRPAELLRALEGELASEPGPERERQLRARAAQLCAERLADEARAEAHWRRVRELAPAHPEACAYLGARFEREGRSAELAEVLEARLAAMEDADPASRAGEAGRRASLRLRLAALRADALGDPLGAVDVLEPLLDEMGPVSAVAGPLAALYARLGHGPALEDLCRSAADAAGAAAEGTAARAGWLRRLGDALAARGADAEAADAYDGALAAQPGDDETERALADALRRLDRPAPLARLLESRLGRAAGDAERDLRLELAALATGPLARPEEALPHLRRVLELEPGHPGALGTAIEVATATGRGAEVLPALDAAIGCAPGAAARADLLARKAALLADALGRPADAARAWREVLSLDPTRDAVWEPLGAALAAAGDTQGLLDALLAQAQRATGDGRSALLARAADVAEARLAPADALPWLARLRAERPDDARVRARATALVRRCGDPTALLRALDDELAHPPTDPAALRRLRNERAHLLEGALAAPARAAEAWEAIRADAPHDPEALAQLVRLYTDLGRPADEARALEALVPLAPAQERLALRRRLATLQRDVLGDPGRAAAELASALEEDAGALGAAARTELLQALGDALAAAGRRADWARVAEDELARLSPEAEVFAERRRTLRAELARLYTGELADPDRALVHLRALVDEPAPRGADSTDLVRAQLDAERDAAERRLLALLRAEGADAELAQRLAARLARQADRADAPDQADAWLELARLRAERLHDLVGAAAAYRETLARRPADVAALRGLRASCERLGDWSEVAATLEREIEGRAGADRAEGSPAPLWRRLGEVAWRRLGSTTQASRAFAAALEADPADEAALHALQGLLEEMEDWRGAIALYESEIELLGSRAADRRHAVWRRVAELARTRTEEPRRAIDAYEAAAALAPLPRGERAALAALYAAADDTAAFVRVATTVCDDAEAPGDAREELDLALALERLGRRGDACARAERAARRDVQHLDAWDALARLREANADPAGAAEALAHAASLTAGAAAATRFRRAAELVEASDGARAFGWLERATACDPADALGHAALTRVAATLGRDAVSARAATNALAVPDALDASLRLATALAGARAARTIGDLPAVAHLLDEALRVAPDHEQALGTRAEIAHALGDAGGIRSSLERWLEVASDTTPGPVRARRLVLLGGALEALSEGEAARARYEAAISCDGGNEDAWSALVALLEKQGATADAIAALELWADATSTPSVRAECLTRAAVALTEPQEAPRARALLERAVEADPRAARAWSALATQLEAAGQSHEALDVATRGLAQVEEPGPRAILCLVRARGLEAAGERREAALAYTEATRLDPRACDAALAAARLRRGLGEWREAAETLQRFASGYADGPREALAPVLLQLGRLRAGPLEDVPGAIEAYERAVAAQPGLREAREALAELLTHQPARWDEAVARHRELLEREPTRAASLRALLRIARGRPTPHGVETGLAVLRALGVASAEEREAAPERLALRVAGSASLDHVVWERARRAVHEVAEEIGQALGASMPAPAPASADRLEAFRDAVRRAEAELSAPGLSLLDPAALGEAVRLVAQLAHDHDHVSGDGPLVNALAGSLGRWARRRVRKALADTAPEEVAEIDFASWRAELRALACAVALDAGGGDLRSALLASIGDGGGPASLPEGADLSVLVEGTADARELLRRVVLAWADRLGGSA